MPPRFAYWTILIDDNPTAFRAREAEELLPTLHQLKRKNANVVMKWFSGGRLWDSPEAAAAARRRPPAAAEKRGPAWRPGGTHQDPRDRFKKKSREKRESGKPSGPPRGDRPWSGKPLPRGNRPWNRKPSGPPRGNRPWSAKPPSGAPPGADKTWRDRPAANPRRADRGWNSKIGPANRPAPQSSRPPSRPWTDRPPKTPWKPFPPRNQVPRSAPTSNERRRRDDEPDKD